MSLAFDPVTQTLYTASADGTVRLWPMAAGDEALAVQDELDPDDPDSPVALRLVAEQQRRSGQTAEATAALGRAAARLQRLIAAFPDRPEYRSELEQVQRNLSLTQAARPIEESPEEMYRRADAMAQGGEDEKAEQLIRKLLEIKPDHASALNSLAWLLAADPSSPVHDPRRAVELAERAVALRRKTPTSGTRSA